MPGANCSVPGCGVNSRETFSDISIFQIPNRKGGFYEKWREDTASYPLTYREVDETFKKRLGNNNVYIYGQYFNLEKHIEFKYPFSAGALLRTPFCFLELFFEFYFSGISVQLIYF